MTQTLEPATLDHAKLEAFVFRAVDEVGATLNTALVVMGDRLGLYRAMAGAGPLSSDELAARGDVSERYTREWLNAQAAGGYVDYDPDSGRYTLPPEQTVALTDAESPAFLPGFFQIALGSVLDSPRIVDAAYGQVVAWDGTSMSTTCSKAASASSGPGYNANLLSSWLPALDGVVEQAGTRCARCRRGMRPRRIHDSHGSRLPEFVLPRLRLPRGSIETARQRAATATVNGHVDFEVTGATSFSGRDYDLVTMFDCLHDMGDPVGAARHVREAIAADGTWMIVEPAAGDRVENNLNPWGAPITASRRCSAPLIALPGGRTRAGCAGWRGADPRRGQRRRLHPLPAGGGNALQHRVRGPALIVSEPKLEVVRPEQTRARYPELRGIRRARAGVRTFYEVYGRGEPTILLLPAWSIVHSRCWKMQIPYLSRHCRVVTFDGRGNGRSDRPPHAGHTQRRNSPPMHLPYSTPPRLTARSLSLGRWAAQRAMVLAADHAHRARQHRVHRPRGATRSRSPAVPRR